MKLNILCSAAVFTAASLFAGCGAKAEPDVCKLVTLADAQSIVNKQVQFNQIFTDKLKALSAIPGICVYSAGADESSPRVVVSYRRYESQDLIKLSFNDSKETAWKKQKQEILGGIGEDAVLLDDSSIAFRKGTIWFQIGVGEQGDAVVSTDGLKSAARKAAASL